MPRMARLLRLPLGLQMRGLLLEVGELGVELRQPLLRHGVGLAGHGHALDLELHDAPLDLVDLVGHGVDLDAQARGGLVDQVDGLVGEEAVGDVAVGEHGRRHQGRVLDLHLVVDLVLLLQAAQDGDGVLDGGLLDQHGLEAPLERGVLLHVLSVLVERRGADAAQLAAGEGGLQHVRRVDGALGRPRADQRVELVDEADDLAFALGDLPEHRLQAVLELAAVLRSRQHGADVEGDQALAAQPLGDVPGDDALGQALDDGGLADAGLADQHGIVLGAAGEHLDHAADLLVAADDRIELALARDVRQVLRVALQRLVLLLGVLVRHPLGAAHLDEGAVDGLGGHAVGGEDAGGAAGLLLGDGDEQVLGRDVLVLQPLRLVPRAIDHALEARRGVRAPSALHLRELRDLGLHLGRHRLRPRAELGEQRAHHALLLLEQCQQQMLRLDRLVVVLVGERLGGLHRLLRLHGQLVESHQFFSVLCFLSSSKSSFSLGLSPAGIVNCTFTYWSPAPPPLRCGMPYPGSRNVRPLDVSGGIFIDT